MAKKKTVEMIRELQKEKAGQRGQHPRQVLRQSKLLSTNSLLLLWATALGK